MNRFRSQLLKHSAIYGLGQLLTRLMSVVLLPVYTRYLSPSDYGVIAILDLAAGVFTILVGSGMAAAVLRFHFDDDDIERQRRNWWTGLSFIALLAGIVLILAAVIRDTIANILLGAEVADGGHLLAILLPTIWCGLLTQILEAYFRAGKRSTTILSIWIGRLLFNAPVNLYLLIVLDLGVRAILIGNLATGLLVLCVELTLFGREAGRPRLARGQTEPLLRFGIPFVVTGLLSAFMHQADRYYLRVFLDLESVGLYSIAYLLAQGVATLYQMPFDSIWRVVIYEMDKSPTREYDFSRIFFQATNVILMIMFGLSLFARPILTLLTGPEFHSAAGLVPVLALGFVFFSLHMHFDVPAFLAKRSGIRIPAALAAAVANLLLNLFLIPRFGVFGAAWATVGTYFTFSFLGLLIYRKIERIRYPFAASATILILLIASYLGWSWLTSRLPSPILGIASAALLWIAWALWLFRDVVAATLKRLMANRV